MMLKIRANISLNNLQTREQFENKRRNFFLPTLDSTILEVKRDVAAVKQELEAHDDDDSSSSAVDKNVLDVCTERVEKILDLCTERVSFYEEKEAEWYLHDENYKTAVEDSTSLRRRAITTVNENAPLHPTAVIGIRSHSDVELHSCIVSACWSTHEPLMLS